MLMLIIFNKFNFENIDSNILNDELVLFNLVKDFHCMESLTQ